MAKIARSQNKLLFSGVNSGFIDLAESLSIVNRRKYEQGRLYHIQSIKCYAQPDDADQGANSRISLVGAPNTWVTANAWYKAKKIWEKMQDQVLKDDPSIAGKWRDFKVYLNEDHFDAGQASNLTPLDGKAAACKEGEWNMSTMTMPDWTRADSADEFELHLCGDDKGDVVAGTLQSGGIIQMYQDTRARVQESPATEDPADSWGVRLLDLGGQESELADNIVGENDEAPYAMTDYPGTTDNQILAWMTSLVVNNYNLTEHSSGFYVPCGLLSLASLGDSDTMYPVLEVTLTPGTYQGVHAPTMRQ